MPCYIERIKPANRAEYETWQRTGYLGTWDDYCRAKEGTAGQTVFICGDLGDHCADCSALGEFLCDFPVGDGKTCDRPICEEHAHEIAPELHYCDAHLKMWQDFKDRGGVDAALQNVVAFKSPR